MTKLLLFVALAEMAGGLVALLTLPQWFVTSRHRSLLWMLRDQIYDDRRRGLLPESVDVTRLIEEVEMAITVIPSLTPILTRRLIAKMPRTRSVPLYRLRGFDAEEVARFNMYRQRLVLLLMRQICIGSWTGISITSFLVVRGWGQQRATTAIVVALGPRNLRVSVGEHSVLRGPIENPEVALQSTPRLNRELVPA